MSKKSRAQRKRALARRAADPRLAAAARAPPRAVDDGGGGAGGGARGPGLVAQGGVRKQAKKRERAKDEWRHGGGGGGKKSAALPVVHEDEALLAVNKPAGMLCHPSPGYWDSGTVVHALRGRQRLAGFSELSDQMLEHRQSHTGEADSFIPRCVVHRLDKGTTGVMVLAKTPAAERALADSFRRHTAKKTYVALLCGRPTRGCGCSDACGGGGALVVNAPVAKDASRPGKMVSGGAATRTSSAKAARSIARLHAHCERTGLSLVSIALLTGRTHQIRVHCAHVLRAPLLGDDAYGGWAGTAARMAREALGAAVELRKRPALHAAKLDVPHPNGGAPLRLRAEMPPDMAAVAAAAWPELDLSGGDALDAWPVLPIP